MERSAQILLLLLLHILGILTINFGDEVLIVSDLLINGKGFANV